MADVPASHTSESGDNLSMHQIELPPNDLPYDDGAPMESPWHRESATLLKASYIAAQGGRMENYFMGCNMFMYYSIQQVQRNTFQGPDLFLVKDVDGKRPRQSWIAWAEDGLYPNLIIELLAETTEQNDLTSKKELYERVFRTYEYVCIAPQVTQLMGWRLTGRRYEPIPLDERQWLFLEEVGLWLGAWEGKFMGHEDIWPRWYTPGGTLVPLPDEAALQQLDIERQRTEQAEEQTHIEHQRANAEHQRVERLESRLAVMAIELARLRGEASG